MGGTGKPARSASKGSATSPPVTRQQEHQERVAAYKREESLARKQRRDRLKSDDHLAYDGVLRSMQSEPQAMAASNAIARFAGKFNKMFSSDKTEAKLKCGADQKRQARCARDGAAKRSSSRASSKGRAYQVA
eukprot:gnl/TRDRNA2_/TRDRNA2_92492_c0_seq1.p1 gnl/TRDRNA2_/TRDRNA2_92492_c0~~gnl/TRDRNA2_/TRDRNA2_92492_c0_seq1.p1  ORF type:complete len:133 (+),score=19.45 gnl/TRDRNA2_/TRDRNA2_92492_c0_seq1:69-467(+)